MARNSLDKLHIELYSPDGKFQGYLKSVSVYHQKVKSIGTKMDAKSYAKVETANGDCELVGRLTHGALVGVVV